MCCFLVINIIVLQQPEVDPVEIAKLKSDAAALRAELRQKNEELAVWKNKISEVGVLENRRHGSGSARYSKQTRERHTRALWRMVLSLCKGNEDKCTARSQLKLTHITATNLQNTFWINARF